MYRQSEKNLLSSNNYLLHMSPQYGELRPTSGSDRFVSLGHTCKFQRVSRLGSVTARHSSSGRQPNFAALNSGHHLYSAGQPSRWALAHISSSFFMVALWNRADHIYFPAVLCLWSPYVIGRPYIFSCCGLFFLLSFFIFHA